MGDSERRSTWYAKGRGWQSACWGIFAVSASVNVVLNAMDDRALSWSAAHLVAVVMGVLLMWNSATRRVEADSPGLKLHELLARDRLIPWSEISEIRPNAPGAWASQLVVVRHDGEVVRLPLAVTERGPIERWEQETHA